MNRIDGKRHRLEVLPDLESLSQAAALVFARIAHESIEARGRFSVALSGGRTPRAVHRLLVDWRDPPIRWEHVTVFWGDERHVPPDHPDSNYGMARETLLSRVPIPPSNVFRIKAELTDADQVARAYESEIRRALELSDNDFPRFDLVILGMGPDGHTASLFPGTGAVLEARRSVIAPWVETLATHRITLTAPAIQNARAVVMMASGAEKAATLREVLEGPERLDELPVQIVHSAKGTVTWLVDRLAISN